MLNDIILDSALPLVPFDGWTEETLRAAARTANLPETEALRAFPDGAAECVEYYAKRADARMEAGLKHLPLNSMKIRDKVAVAIMMRLEQHQAEREAIRRGIALLSLPQHAARGMKSLYHTVDAIWHSIGDTSTDFNFYTKRLTLAAVYSTTLRVFLDDDSPDLSETKAFLDRRIEDVMKIEKAKAKMRGLSAKWKDFAQPFMARKRAS